MIVGVVLAEAQYPRGAGSGPAFTPLLRGKDVQRYLEPPVDRVRSSLYHALIAIYGEGVANDNLALSNRADAFSQFIAWQGR
jgi:hypothetical protein